MQKVSNFQEKLDAFRKQRIVSDTIEYTLIAVFLLPYAVAVNQLLVPHNIVGGGLTGISEILYFATERFIPIWLTSLTVNAILLIVAIMTIGWQFCVRTIWGVLWLAFWLKLIPIGEQPMLSDPFMSCVIAGLFCGATNCPLTSIFIAIELFGLQAMPFYVITIAACYMMSGYYSLYSTQIIYLSKFRMKVLDRKTH